MDLVNVAPQPQEESAPDQAPNELSTVESPDGPQFGGKRIHLIFFEMLQTLGHAPYGGADVFGGPGQEGVFRDQKPLLLADWDSAVTPAVDCSTEWS